MRDYLDSKKKVWKSNLKHKFFKKIRNITTGVKNTEIVKNSPPPPEKSKKLGGFANFNIENPAVFFHFLSQKYTSKSIYKLL